MSSLVIQGQAWAALKEQAAILLKSKMITDAIKTPEEAIAIAIKGQEIGMPMMQAFAQISIIKGKPCLSAEGINFQIRKNCPNAKIEPITMDNEKCVVRVTRPGNEPCEFSFTMEDAKRAGLTGNQTWQKYPKAMLWARCITIIGRTVFPDCLSGISYTPEELGAEVNEDGEIISIPGDDKKENKSVGTNTKQTILDHVSPRDPKSKVSQSEGETLIECAKAAGWQRVEVLNFTEANYGVKKISDLLVADYTDFMENVFQLGMSYQQAMKNVLEFSGPSDETEAPL